MMRNRSGEPIPPADVMPHGMCQPPIDAMSLIERLSPAEAQRILRCLAIWVPEVLEQGLLRVSEDRELLASALREQPAGGDPS